MVNEACIPFTAKFWRDCWRSYATGPTGSERTKMSALLSLNSIIVATSEQVSCPLGEESCILNLKNSSYYGLDPVGACVWNLLREPRTVGDLRNALLDEYEVEAES